MSGTDGKPEDMRCPYCFDNGDCDRVAITFGWCGLVKLAAAVEEQ